MEGLGRVLETQQHVREHGQRPLTHNGVPQTTEYLWVEFKKKKKKNHLLRTCLFIEVLQ